MRIRCFAAVLAVIPVLALAGCGGDAPAPTQPKPGEVSPEALLTKTISLTADPCFSAPEQQKYWLCEKYVTQLGSFSGTVAKLGERFTALREPAHAMSTAIDGYRGAGCEAEGAPDAAACTARLGDMRNSLDTIRTHLREAPTETG